ncbi:hypothetical protein [Streptomyces sp. NPDC052701]|uniref:hypothetical protein n=1 Tax=Streptomyces sp. NPDC052701 TaxID=3155533 RepID=UPI0034311DD7
MHSNDDTDRTTDGLSTEDLAQPSGTTTGTTGGTEEDYPGAPMYPGEGTATTGTPGTTDEPATDEPATAEPATEPAGTEPAAGTATTGAAGTPGASDASGDEAPQLLTEDEDRAFRDRWQEVQSKFVDDPREAVHEADSLVADVMQTLAATFAQHKKDLEGQWGQGEQVDTEELRGALRRYRSFFNRLLST